MIQKLNEAQQKELRDAVIEALGTEYALQMNYIALVMVPNQGRRTFVPIKEQTPISSTTISFENTEVIQREEEDDKVEPVLRA